MALLHSLVSADFFSKCLHVTYSLSAGADSWALTVGVLELLQWNSDIGHAGKLIEPLGYVIQLLLSKQAEGNSAANDLEKNDSENDSPTELQV